MTNILLLCLFSPFACSFYSIQGYFGKVGMRYFHKTNQQYHCPTINIDRVWTLVTDETRQKYAEAGEADKVPVIDVTRFVSKQSNIVED